MDSRVLAAIIAWGTAPKLRGGLGKALPAVTASAVVGLAAAMAAQAEMAPAPVDLAQAYDVPAMPPPAAPTSYQPIPQAPISGSQYVVYVTSSGGQMLEQVKLVEPTAFQTSFQGATVIQAGRFSVYDNAQRRVSDLASLGIGANIAEVQAAVPYYAQTPAPPANVYAATGELPPLPVTTVSPGGVPAVPTAAPAGLPPSSGSVEFGQQLSYGATATPNAYPVNIPPPSGAAPVTAAATVENAPYYVVIPTSESDLPTVSSQVIQLGAPASQVQQRTAPLGPHVAIGPFTDRGLAQEWTSFFREAGFGSSRVYFDR